MSGFFISHQRPSHADLHKVPMSEENASAHLILNIDLGKDADPDELDRQTRQLRAELQDLIIESVRPLRSGEVPEGAKAVEAVTLGALALAVLPVFVPKLVEFLQSWVNRAEYRKIKVKTQVGDRSIELEYAPEDLSSRDIKRLVSTLTAAMAEGQRQS